jgi:hypothetical protein
MLTVLVTALIATLASPLFGYWVLRIVAMIRLSEAAFDALLLQDLSRLRRFLR